jgi:tetratricopeptide (TPR) repeat protein
MSTNAVNGIRLDHVLGATERGTLWRGTRQRSGDRIVRLIDSRFCNFRFRNALSSLRASQQPRTLPIASDGFAGGQFYLEYVADGRWITVESHFEMKHWRDRLRLLQQLCEAFAQWNKGTIRPLGLNICNVIMVKDANVWFPWLLPCPPVEYSSPFDLLNIGEAVLSSLAPEIVRDIEGDTRMQDSYALGSLALRALGITESRSGVTMEEFLEEQACGARTGLESKPAEVLKNSAVEPFLHSLGAMERLLLVIRHYLQAAPEARPVGPSELFEACDHALKTTEPISLATELLQRGNSREALKVLAWGREKFGEDLQNLLLAVEICKKIEDFAAAVQHLSRIIGLIDHAGSGAIEDFQLRLDLCQQRCDLCWLLYENLPPLKEGEADAYGETLLMDIAWLRVSGYEPHERNEHFRRAAAIYRRRGDLTGAAQKLYEAAGLEPSDLTTLFLYGDCLKELGEQEAVAQLLQEARRRVERMTLAEFISASESQLWLEKFDMLLQP